MGIFDKFEEHKYVGIDFEFRPSANKDHELVCCALAIFDKDTTYKRLYWLNEGNNKDHLVKELKRLALEGYIFIAYAVTAEARCFLTLGLNPVEFHWFDLRLEHVLLTNQSSVHCVGTYIGKKKDGVYIATIPPNDVNTQSMPRNLINFYHKFLGWDLKKIQDIEKSQTIDLILSKDEYTEEEKTKILDYCFSDVIHLYEGAKNCANIIHEKFKSLYSPQQSDVRNNYVEDALMRGRDACFAALMERRGYPVNTEWLKNFRDRARQYQKDVCEDINSQFKVDPFLVYNVNSDKYVKKEKAIRERISKNDELDKIWRSNPDFMTEKGKYSLKYETLNDVLKLAYHGPKYNYERYDFIAQFVRYKQTEKNLSGFIGSQKNSIFNNLCEEDSRVRYNPKIYGAKTSRSTPPGSKVLFLKSRWIRSFVQPTTDEKFICGIDYSSQEVLLQAMLSGDEKLYNSYARSDVYMDFAKSLEWVPENGTRKDYELERSVAKTAFLSIGYGVGAKTLQKRIQKHAGESKTYSISDARMIIRRFELVYDKYAKWRGRTMDKYNRLGYLTLADNWAILGKPTSRNTVLNFPIQGTGAVIMREAVRLCYSQDIDIIMTLHDALYAELYTEKQVHTFKSCMRQAFINTMARYRLSNQMWGEAIRVDAECWGSYFEKNGLDCFEDKTITTKTIYLADEQAAKDFESLKKYFV